MLVMWNQVVKAFKGQLNWVAKFFTLQFSREATKTQHSLPSSSCVGKWHDRCSYSSSTQVITKLGVCLLNHCQIPASSHQIHAQHLPFTNAGIPLKAIKELQMCCADKRGISCYYKWLCNQYQWSFQSFSWSSDGQITICMTSIYGVQFVQI